MRVGRIRPVPIQQKVVHIVRPISGRVHKGLILEISHLGFIYVECVNRHWMTVGVTGIRFPRVLHVDPRLAISFDFRAFYNELILTSGNSEHSRGCLRVQLR